MEDLLQSLNDTFQASPEIILLGAIGLGVMIFIYGLSATFAGPTAEARRMAAGGRNQGVAADYDLVRGDDNDTQGLLRAFVPTSNADRSRIRKQLRMAGIQRKNSVLTYYFVRSALAFILPAIYLLAINLPPELLSRLGLFEYLSGQTIATIFSVVTVLAVLGFYLPSVWLKRKIAVRKQKIWETMPNGLDLLQVAVEAGLGFDAAIVRVGHELSSVAPDLASEFMMLQLEIQAGKDKSRAFLDMAERTGVDEMASFANVILQAGQFGSSISQALTTYSEEMRVERELRAQEKANRLPVQMSAVMAVMMMPALLLICLTPMIIRWIRVFGV